MTDHVAMAESQLDRARREVPDTYSQQLIMSAQVHATLALVEQQRIANLIAIYGSEGSVESGYVGNGFDLGGMADEIREGLGL